METGTGAPISATERRLRVLSAQLGAVDKPKMKSTFENVPAEAPDRILGLNAAFREDPDSRKVNLGVGAYRDENGAPYVLPVIRKIEQDVAAELETSPRTVNHEYLPQGGLAEFCSLSAQLMFGKDSTALREGRVVTVQALSGTGALRIAFEFTRKLETLTGAPRRDVYIPKPTWSNHKNVVRDCGLEFREYCYLDYDRGAVDFEGMKADLRAAPPGSIILLHPCAHNPSGADPSQAQWEELRLLIQERQLMPLFDTAYQGFASGSLEKDAYAIRLFANSGMEMMACQSFAKSAGMYGERIGAFSVVCATPKPADAVKSQLFRIIRGLYSSPPLHGARVMARLMGNADLFKQWEGEMVNMSGRIQLMRKQLRGTLVELDNISEAGRWDRIVEQIGMFSFTGLTRRQVQYLRTECHIYMTDDGRISMAGLNPGNIQYVAESIVEAVKASNGAKED